MISWKVKDEQKLVGHICLCSCMYMLNNHNKTWNTDLWRNRKETNLWIKTKSRNKTCVSFEKGPK